MKLLYLTTWDFSNEESDGVCKKIYSHVKTFEQSGLGVDFIYLKNGKIYYRKGENTQEIGRVGSVKKTIAYIKMYKYLKKERYDWIYNRYGMMDTFYYRVLKRLKKNGAKIIIEIPTYPYIGEKIKGFSYEIMYKWDEIYLHKLKKVVERIVTYSKDEEIWEIPTFQVINGIALDRVNVKKEKGNTEPINLLAIALMQQHHGYERIIKGLKKYYDAGGTRAVKLHMVGDGPERETYVQMVNKYDLNDKVVFYGNKNEIELEEIYNYMDIGICSLGAYKKGLYVSSELKSREYLAKGLPIVSGVTIDIFENNENKYYLEFTNDESVIDVVDIINFYDEIYCDNDSARVITEVRNLAEQYVGIEKAMAAIINYMKIHS